MADILPQALTRKWDWRNDNIYGWILGGNASSPSITTSCMANAGNDNLYGGT